jgi:hypothetical protein
MAAPQKLAGALALYPTTTTLDRTAVGKFSRAEPEASAASAPMTDPIRSLPAPTGSGETP